jgi:magnesium-transporting ATPase (P-type)
VSEQTNLKFKTHSGMGNKALPLMAFREGGWMSISSEELLPGDMVSIRPNGT